MVLRYWHIRYLEGAGNADSNREWDKCFEQSNLESLCKQVREYAESSCGVRSGRELDAMIRRTYEDALQVRIWTTEACQKRKYKTTPDDEQYTRLWPLLRTRSQNAPGEARAKQSVKR